MITICAASAWIEWTARWKCIQLCKLLVVVFASITTNVWRYLEEFTLCLWGTGCSVTYDWCSENYVAGVSTNYVATRNYLISSLWFFSFVEVNYAKKLLNSLHLCLQNLWGKIMCRDRAGLISTWFQNATLVRGQEMRCPTCNRPNEETFFEEAIKRQGIYFQT